MAAGGGAGGAEAEEAAKAEADEGGDAAVVFAAAGEVFEAFLDEEGDEDEGADGVGPPPGEEGVEAEADEDGDVLEVAEEAFHGLSAEGVGLHAGGDAHLGDVEDGHDDGAGDDDGDACDAGLGLGEPASEVGTGVEDDVEGEEEEGEADKALGATLGTFGFFLAQMGGQAPDEDAAGKEFDDAVEAEGEDGNAAGLESCPQSDDGLDEVPEEASDDEEQGCAAEGVCLRHLGWILLLPCDCGFRSVFFGAGGFDDCPRASRR